MKTIEDVGGQTTKVVQMPGKPGDIHICPWTLPGVQFHSPDAEEAAARIIHFSKQSGQWAGVSWTQLKEMMDEEIRQGQLYECRQEVRRAQRERQMAAAYRHRLLCTLTLGVYGRLKPQPKPIEPELPTPTEHPCSGIFECGESYVWTGIKNLVRSGFIEVQQNNNGGVFFPTPKLIGMIKRGQGS